MSRLDSFIRRLAAQRECLGMAALLVADVPGPVLELGLGNGRTFDHLRTLFPNRDIFAFDRQLAAHPDCIPAPKYLVLGDLQKTLIATCRGLSVPPVFVHADFGSGSAARDSETVAFLRTALPDVLHALGVIATDQKIDPEGWHPQPLPKGIESGRYFLYRRPKM
jgi:hypothetical protein